MRPSRRPIPSSRGSGTARLDLARWARWNESSRTGKKPRSTTRARSGRANRHQAQEGRLGRVAEGLKNLVRDDVPDIYDPALVELNLEICAMPSRRLRRPGWNLAGQAARVPGQLIARLYQIEVPKGSPQPDACCREAFLMAVGEDRAGQGCRPSECGKSMRSKRP